MSSSPSSHFTYTFLLIFSIISSIHSFQLTATNDRRNAAELPPLRDTGLVRGELVKYVTDLGGLGRKYVAEKWKYTPKTLAVTPMPNSSFALLGTGVFENIDEPVSDDFYSFASMRLGIRFNGSDKASAFRSPAPDFWEFGCEPLVLDCYFSRKEADWTEEHVHFLVHVLVRPISQPGAVGWKQCSYSSNVTWLLTGHLSMLPGVGNIFLLNARYRIDDLFNDTFVTHRYAISTGIAHRAIGQVNILEFFALTRICRRSPFAEWTTNEFESYVISSCQFSGSRCVATEIAAPSNTTFSTPPDLIKIQAGFSWKIAAINSVQAPQQTVHLDQQPPFVPLHRHNVTVTLVQRDGAERKVMFEQWIHLKISSPCAELNDFDFLRLTDAIECLLPEACKFRVVYVSAEAGSYSVYIVELSNDFEVLSTRKKSLETNWHAQVRDNTHVVTVTNMRATVYEPGLGRRLLVLLVQFYVLEPPLLKPSDRAATYITYYFDMNSKEFDSNHVIGFLDPETGRMFGVGVRAPIAGPANRLVAKSSGAALLLLGVDRSMPNASFYDDAGTLLVGNTFYDESTVNTLAPTDAPTRAPSRSPTKAPSESPSKAPSEAPSQAPTESPTKMPVMPATATESAMSPPPSTTVEDWTSSAAPTATNHTNATTHTSSVFVTTAGHTHGHTTQALHDDSSPRDVVLVLLALVIVSVCVIIGCFVFNHRRQRTFKRRLEAMSLLDNDHNVKESEFLSEVHAGVGESGSPPRSGLDELATIDHRDVKLGAIVGTGSFGQVHRAHWRGADVAVKLLRADANRDRFVDEFRLEARRLRSLPPHPNVVSFYGVTTPMADGGIGLVFAYMPGGALDRVLYRGRFEEELCTSGGHLSLFDNLERSETSSSISGDSYGPTLSYRGTLRASFKVSWIHGTLLGLHHLHSEGIVHRDLAARNILLDARWQAVIADFGMSRAVQDKEEAQGFTKSADFGPVQWMAPEQFKKKGVYSFKTDMYSFGCLIYEILMRSKPFEGIHLPDVIVKVCAGERPMFTDEGADGGFLPAALVQMATQCWLHDSSKRPSTDVLLSHPFFGVDTESVRSARSPRMTPVTRSAEYVEEVGVEDGKRVVRNDSSFGNIRSGLFQSAELPRMKAPRESESDEERERERRGEEEQREESGGREEEEEEESKSSSKQSNVTWEHFLSDDYLQDNQ